MATDDRYDKVNRLYAPVLSRNNALLQEQERLDRKLDAFQAKRDRQGGRLSEHDEEIEIAYRDIHMAIQGLLEASAEGED